MHVLWKLTSLVAAAIQVSGCASEQVIAKDLQGEVGKVVVLGGEVLTGRRLKDGTQLEVLELPLDHSQRPVEERTRSEGRFLAIERAGFLDPATLTDGTPVTIVGEVTGMSTQRLDEADYHYPTIEVKHLKVWERSPAYAGPALGPRFGIYGGTGMGGRGIGGGAGVGIGF